MPGGIGEGGSAREHFIARFGQVYFRSQQRGCCRRYFHDGGQSKPVPFLGEDKRTSRRFHFPFFDVDLLLCGFERRPYDSHVLTLEVHVTSLYITDEKLENIALGAGGTIEVTFP